MCNLFVLPIKRRFRDSQIVIITNLLAVSSVAIKRADCISENAQEMPHHEVQPSQDTERGRDEEQK